MPDENTERDINDASEQAEPAADADTTTSEPKRREGHEGHSLKRELREGAAKVAGFAVEVGSILGQQGGEAVQAEKDMAEAETEEFIDRIDGEG